MFKAKPGGGVHETSTKQRGDLAEARALAHLQAQGLVLVQRNYRVALGPNGRGGEVDLILRERDGTLVFVEVRARAATAFGGALASVTPGKQRRLLRLPAPPPCRFDVVAIDGAALQWVKGAFDAG